MTTSGQNTIPVGYVRRAHGIRGDVVFRALVADAEARLVKGAVFHTDEEPPRALTLSWATAVGDDFRVHIAGVEDRDAAETLRGKQFMMDTGERRELGEGEWWPEDLVGCRVVDLDGESLGDLVDVVTGVQDRLVVERPDGARAEIPFVHELVPTLDLDSRTITVDLPEGLFE